MTKSCCYGQAKIALQHGKYLKKKIQAFNRQFLKSCAWDAAILEQAVGVQANCSSVVVLPEKKYHMNSVKFSHGVILEERFMNETFF